MRNYILFAVAAFVATLLKSSPGLVEYIGLCERKIDLEDLFPFVPFIENVSKVEIIESRLLTAEKFLMEYVQLSKPLLIKNGIKSWGASSKWTNEYLLSKLGNETVKIEFSSDNIFRYTNLDFTNYMTFADFIKVIENANNSNHENYYITGIPNIEPLYPDLKEIPFAKYLNRYQVGFWMGSGGQVTPVHIDECENIMAVFSGTKKFTLFDPTLSKYMYPLHINNLYASAVELNNPDLSKYPKYAKALPHKLVVNVEAGDMLFIPAFWWHEVQSEGRNIGVNFFYNAHSLLLHSFYAGIKDKIPSSVDQY